MKNKLTLVLLILTNLAIGQKSISLKQCYHWVDTNYPLIKQQAINEEKHTLDIDIMKRMKLPSLSLSAKTTFQSDVTNLPIDIPMIDIESPNLFQYKANVTGNYLLYDGGLINEKIKAKSMELKTQEKQIEITLYQLKNKINQLYFSILLLQEKKLLLKSNIAKIKTKIQEVQTGIEYGIIIPSTTDLLEVELLKINQLILEVDQDRIGLLKTLSQLTFQEIPFESELEINSVNNNQSQSVTRPEFEMFEIRKQQLDMANNVIAKENSPKIFAFANTGFGNPGLNMLDNSLQPFFLMGVQLNWKFHDWGISKKKQASMAISKKLIDNQEELFRLQTNIDLEQQQSEINKTAVLLKSDKDIIKLRNKILDNVSLQLNNGTTTPSSYTDALMNLFEAKNRMKIHQIKQLLAEANYQIIKGN